MKNFKKVLALVLAIATLLSFATVASAKTADFTDAADVANVEAVDVLSYIKVLEGYPADNSFKPAKNITREEAAKIIAIFANGSADISTLYTSANPFVDEKGRWGESYVAYGYRAGIIAGKSATEFAPSANVNGTEFLKMVLVVLGYDANKEGLVGSSWAVNTLELAKAKGLLEGLGSSFDPSAALTRDQAAQIMLNALKAETVVYGQTVTNLTWNASAGYWMVGTGVSSNALYVSPNGATNNYQHTLLAAKFNLSLTEGSDTWGRPTHTWAKGSKTIGTYVNSDELVATYKTAVTECDVAADYGMKTNTQLDLYVNANKSAIVIRPLATAASIGAQGRLTEVYEDRIVMIDTFLAKVTGVKDVAYDANGHIVSDATISLTVYDNATGTSYSLTSTSNFPYAVGDYVLLNSTTANSATATTSSTVTTVYGEIVGKASTIEGAQSVIWYNASKHTVDGTTYDDAINFKLDQAGTETTKHTWYFDSYGNLIGATDIATVYSYGVITKIYAETINTGARGFKADVTYIDGTTNTVTLAKGEGKSVTYGYNNNYGAGYEYFYLYNEASLNETYDKLNTTYKYINDNMMKFETLSDGTISFSKVTTEIESASVINKYAYIDNVKIDSETKVLYRGTSKNSDGSYTYTAVTGMNDMPSFKSGAVVDYVLGSDGVADYIFVLGDTVDSTSKAFVYVSGTSYSAVLKDLGGIKYYEVTLPVPAEDGSVVTLKVKESDKTGVLDVLTASSNSGKLFYVTYTGDYATAVSTVDTTPKNYVTSDADSRAVALNYAKMSNGVIEATFGRDTARFNVLTATTVIGELKADMTDKVVYVLYNAKNNNVEKVYVSDVTSTTPSATPTSTGTVVYYVQFVNAYGTAQGEAVKAATQTNVAAQDYVLSYTNFKAAVDANGTDWTNEALTAALLNGTTNGSTEAFTVVANGTTTVTFTVIK